MKPSNIIPTRNWHVLYIAERMRPDEISHWLAVTGAKEYDPEVAAAGFINTPGLRFTVTNRDGTPAFIVGWYEAAPACWIGWAIGTMAGWDEQWRSITKAVVWLLGEVERNGARHMAISTIAERLDARRWYRRSLKLTYEGRHRAAGAQGQDIVFYSRIAGVNHGR
jgi:hypothetical protein